MATGVKSAGFAILVRIFLTALVDQWSHLWEILWVLAVLTMTVGNWLALVQNNIKRMLAYSSIAHAGYLLVGLSALVASLRKSQMEAFGPTYAIMYYLLVYLFMNLGAFAIIVILGREGRGGEMIDDYSDLARKRPFLAALMTVFMLSLAGVPPLGGFFAKFYIFQFAVHNQLISLTVIAVLNSVIAAYYYLRVVYVMYMRGAREEVETPTVEQGVLINAVLIFSAAMVIILGLAPGNFLDIIFMTFRKFV
jgi:NADH-quinone oxidoreductase subunit N